MSIYPADPETGDPLRYSRSVDDTRLPLLEPPETTVHSAAEALRWPPGHAAELGTVFRHSGWKRHRAAVYASLQRTKQTLARRIAFSTCGSHAYVIRSLSDPSNIRLAGSTCHDRFCVPCAKDRSAVIVRNVMDRLTDVPVRFITLTLKADDEPLESSIRRLTTAFSSLRRRKLWTNSIAGGVAFLEVHWSRNGQRWHPHMHILVQGRFLDQAKLSQAWYAITGDSKIVDVRLVRNPTHLARYVAKYASKPLNASFANDQSLLDTAVSALKGKRMCVTFGTWQGVQLTETPNEGEWENLGSFTDFIHRASMGNAEAVAILRSLAPGTADDLMEISRNARPPPSRQAPKLTQLTFYETWNKEPEQCTKF